MARSLKAWWKQNRRMHWEHEYAENGVINQDGAKVLLSQLAARWVPVTERNPKKSGTYLILCNWPKYEDELAINEAYYCAKHKEWIGSRIKYWMENMPRYPKGKT